MFINCYLLISFAYCYCRLERSFPKVRLVELFLGAWTVEPPRWLPLL